MSSWPEALTFPAASSPEKSSRTALIVPLSTCEPPLETLLTFGKGRGGDLDGKLLDEDVEVFDLLDGGALLDLLDEGDLCEGLRNRLRCDGLGRWNRR